MVTDFLIYFHVFIFICSHFPVDAKNKDKTAEDTFVFTIFVIRCCQEHLLAVIDRKEEGVFFFANQNVFICNISE